jgi:hypothetical protein
MCVYHLTFSGICGFGLDMMTPAKKKVLREAGMLNPHPEAVRSALFTMEFFDAWDRAQVKYEILRAHSVDGDAVAEACHAVAAAR